MGEAEMTTEIKSHFDTAMALQFGVIAGDKLTRWEADFLSDMRKRFDRFGDKTMVSEKQAAIIKRIADKAN
jgi:hypothetical protein